jgi:uncharacterized protein (UPF0332 family)
MKAEELMAKARQAVISARALYDLNDMDGACNRAYYAMFDAARAALMQSGAPVGSEVARTHSGLITAFGLHLVKPGRLPLVLGRAINRAEELRLVADYTGAPVDSEQASWAVENAEAFVTAIAAEFF